MAVAFALQADGWYLRQDIIWSKPNPMPESVRDRCTKAHEYLFLLSKSERYHYDADAIREPFADASIERLRQDITNQRAATACPARPTAHEGGGLNANRSSYRAPHRTLTATSI
jgi:DNA modification methylase